MVIGRTVMYWPKDAATWEGHMVGNPIAGIITDIDSEAPYHRGMVRLTLFRPGQPAEPMAYDVPNGRGMAIDGEHWQLAYGT